MICKFCGFLAQVKATTLAPDGFPARVLGGAWRPQHEQILADIFHALFVVTLSPDGEVQRIYYVPSHILRAHPEVYEPRAPLSADAKRANWQGFVYHLKSLPAIGISQVYPRDSPHETRRGAAAGPRGRAGRRSLGETAP